MNHVVVTDNMELHVFVDSKAMGLELHQGVLHEETKGFDIFMKKQRA